ncbi:MAG: hypothetical protein KGL39_29215 [Patescibacteria group bacterium]|nr:hypothetical protein [Patescibacteria group bacterium]
MFRRFVLTAIAAVLTLSGCGHNGADFRSQNRPVGHVKAYVYHHHKLAYVEDLGFGAVTNVGVTAMANDGFWAAPSGAAINTLALAKFCATGTGTTSAAATDVALQTSDGIASVTGTPSLVSAANSQAYRVVCTMNYTGTEAVTEFGLFTNGTLSATTGTPFTAGSATTGTVTGTPYTASSSTVQGEQQFVIEDTTKSPKIYGLILSNTSSVLTVPAWYKVTDGTAAGTTPANTDALAILPVMLDHKVFSAINVNNGDSIQFTYTLTINSGG